MTCKTCGNTLSEQYLFCPECGETAHPHRLDLKHIIHEFVHAFTHADKGIFLLVKELALHPGRAAAEYADGSRKKYFNPVSFLLITGGITFFLRHKLKIIEAFGGKKGFVYAGDFLHQYTTPIIVLMIPLLSLYSWLLFRSTGKNYAENMVMNMYMMGEYHLFSIFLLVIPSWLFPRFSMVFIGAGFLVMAMYYYFTCINFFRQAVAITIFKVIAVEILFFITFIMLMSLSFFLYIMQNGLHIRDFSG